MKDNGLLAGEHLFDAGGTQAEVAIRIGTTEVAEGNQAEEPALGLERQKRAFQMQELIHNRDHRLTGQIKRRQGAQLKSNSPRIGAALAQLEDLCEGTLDGSGGDNQTDGETY